MYAKRLKELRSERNITLKEIAEQTGISFSAYASYEAGQRKPQIDTLILLTKFFNTTSDYILGLSNIRYPVSETNKLETVLTQGKTYWNDKRLNNTEIEHLINTLNFITEK